MIVSYSYAAAAFCALLAFFWGFVWAWYLNEREYGKFLAVKRTWLTVVVGIGVDMLVLLPLLYTRLSTDPLVIWLQVVAIISLSAVGIVARSLRNEYSETREEMERARRKSVQ